MVAARIVIVLFCSLLLCTQTSGVPLASLPPPPAIGIDQGGASTHHGKRSGRLIERSIGRVKECDEPEEIITEKCLNIGAKKLCRIVRVQKC